MRETPQRESFNIPPPARRGADVDTTAPDGSEIRLLLDHRHYSDRASMVEVTLPSGRVSRPVYHRTVEELWYFLEGRGQVWRCPPDADPTAVAPVAVEAGDALTIPVGWRFQFSADAAGGLRFLCVTIPPWPGAEEAVAVDYGGLGPATV